MRMRDKFGLGAPTDRPARPPRRDRPAAKPKPRETATFPETCWLCSNPTLGGRAVCADHAAELEARAARIREGRRER